eukprot:15043580-Ditylum_brightwellii.AAC.1
MTEVQQRAAAAAAAIVPSLAMLLTALTSQHATKKTALLQSQCFLTGEATKDCKNDDLYACDA